MQYIDQEIAILFENKINYQKIDKLDRNQEDIEIKNIDQFYERNRFISSVSIITGSNGIGKSFLLSQLKEKFELDNKKVMLIKFKDFNNLENIKACICEDTEIILFDGLDEININIMPIVLEYVFSISDKKIIVSSRKDYLQKHNMLDIKYNIYEIKQFEDYKIDRILLENNLSKESCKQIYNLLKIPRFLIHLLNVKDDINTKSNINKYELLDMIINKHFDVLNDRAIIKLEKNIHKKILQSLALVMMMAGKTNLTMEEFSAFLSKITYLDVKSYILNKELIDSFLNNQILLNFGDLIMFENKELMEFLAAKEIYENNLSNQELFEIVSMENSKEINTLWFNTLTYLTYKSNTYNKLILDYVFNNLDKQDNLLDFLLNVDFYFVDNELVENNIEKIILQYTKLYQYITSYSNTNDIFKILSNKYKICYNSLIEILIKIKIKENMTDFDVIFINNLLSCILYVIENSYFWHNDAKKIKRYFSKNEEYYMCNDRLNVRYLNIYLHLFSPEDIDKLIAKNTINKRLLSIFLHQSNNISSLKNLDYVINNYILNCKNKFSELIINEKLIVDFITNNYDLNRIKTMLNNITNDSEIANFIHFLNSNQSEKLWNLFDKKSIVKILYNKIVKLFIENSGEYNRDIREEILFDRRHGDALEIIITLCIKYEFIILKDLNDILYQTNYIVKYMRELIIKVFLIKYGNVSRLYRDLNEKEDIFTVWKLDLDNELRNSLKNEINKYFPEKTKEYNKIIARYENDDYVKADNSLNEIQFAKNIYYKIDNTYELIKNEKQFALISSNLILKNTLKLIAKEIENHVKNIDVEKLIIKHHKDQTYTISYDFQLYSKAIYILFKMNIDINVYNDKNIILLNNNTDEISPIYNDEDYKKLLSYLDKKSSKDYIDFYLYDIIYKIKKYNPHILLSLVFKWIEYIKFEEYKINYILSFITENIELLTNKEIDKLKQFRKYKICQDIFIELGVAAEIADRIEYIKQNLVFEGDLMTIEESGNFEYSSGTYINPIAKIGIKNIKYIYEILEFMFEKYNQGNYYYFAKYILEMVYKFININIDSLEINSLINFIVDRERNNNNRYLYEMCNNISFLRKSKNKQISQAIQEYNMMMYSSKKKIYNYEDLYNVVKNILENNIFDDILRMGFLEIFRNNETLEIKPLKEESYQFLIGYELSRLLSIQGFSAKVFYESTAFDKKRSDIQVVSEGFIEDIIIETKLTNNSDISNEISTLNYINNTLEIYKTRFNSPKILFVLINQKFKLDTCEKKINWINKNNNGTINPVLIDLQRYFKKNNKSAKKS